MPSLSSTSLFVYHEDNSVQRAYQLTQQSVNELHNSSPVYRLNLSDYFKSCVLRVITSCVLYVIPQSRPSLFIASYPGDWTYIQHGYSRPQKLGSPFPPPHPFINISLGSFRVCKCFRNVINSQYKGSGA